MRLERAVSKVTADMLSLAREPGDAELLGQLSGIARDVEEISSRSSYRFAAARAYAALVRQAHRGTGLREGDELPAHRRLLDRRFGPAMATCRAVADRITNLANAASEPAICCAPASTSRSEGQNQKLLASVDKRGQQQLRLQQTVEAPLGGGDQLLHDRHRQQSSSRPRCLCSGS